MKGFLYILVVLCFCVAYATILCILLPGTENSGFRLILSFIGGFGIGHIAVYHYFNEE